jgi:16S rRNA (cytosine1402-N4)-methyltransferase
MENSSTLCHIPVLPAEVLKYIGSDNRQRKIIDGTLGNGGHSALILQQNPQAELLGIDRDGEALERAQKKLAFANERLTLVRGQYSELDQLAETIGWNRADVILLDIGLSSPQIDDPRRGFSLRQDGPLDMRMDKRSVTTASRLLNREPQTELARIFYEYGEIRRSRRLAAEIVARREERPFMTTLDFANFCDQVLGKARPGKLPTPTLCFQALRIAVNSELEELRRGLKAAVKMLNPAGILVVISFHSLEDRIVKNFFKEAATDCICPPGMPICICDHQAILKIVTRKPITANKDECAVNSRAACAKMRVATKI